MPSPLLLLAALVTVAQAADTGTVQRPAAPVTPVASAVLKLGTDDTVTVAGRATVEAWRIQSGALDFMIDDGTGGLRIFSRHSRLPIKAGDSVVATGVIRTYRGDRELVATAVRVVPASPRLVEATDIPLSTVAMEQNWGRLVTVRGRAAGFGRAEGGQWLRLASPRTGDTATATIWVGASHGGQVNLEPMDGAAMVSVTGLVTAFRDNPEDRIVWQIVPRDGNDIARLDGGVWLGRLLWTAAVLLLVVFVGLTSARMLARRHARELDETVARYRQLLELIPDAVIVHEGGKVLFTNPAAVRLLDLPDEEALVGRELRQFVAPESEPLVRTRRQTPVAMEEPARMRGRMLTSSGAPVEVEITASPCRYHDRAATVVLVRDISQQLRVERDLESLALLDELTGLHNRRGFTLFAEQELARVRRYGRPAMLVFADMDGLKRINDRHGHAAGDVALRRVARALRSIVREADIVARWAGDEFVALLLEGSADAAAPAISSPDALQRDFETRLQAALDAQAADLPYRLSATVGTCRLDAPGVTSLADAMRVADEELYRRKGHGSL